MKAASRAASLSREARDLEECGHWDAAKRLRSKAAKWRKRAKNEKAPLVKLQWWQE